MERIGVIERAFQLASDSESLTEVKLKLAHEGYASVEAHLAGPQIKRDLKTRMKAAQPPG